MKQKTVLEIKPNYLKTILLALIPIVLVVTSYVFFSPALLTQPTLAQCLTSKGVVMYGADSCEHCQDQKKIFGKDFENIKYVNCEFDFELCKARGVTSYPLWSFGNKILLGTQSKAQLSSFAECTGNP